jgi:hypothetical protein
MTRPAVGIAASLQMVAPLPKAGIRIAPRDLVYINGCMLNFVRNQRVAQRGQHHRLARPGGPVSRTANTRRVSRLSYP